MQRLVDFVQRYHVRIRLAYYPPYHSKYNPIERCWGILETHWNGALLDSIEAVLQFARTMTWKGTPPGVELVTTTYQTGVKLTAEAMDRVEAQLKRLPLLGKWFVDLGPAPPSLWASSLFLSPLERKTRASKREFAPEKAGQLK
jgi:Rhodopirellula transposase DDE domain